MRIISDQIEVINGEKTDILSFLAKNEHEMYKIYDFSVVPLQNYMDELVAMAGMLIFSISNTKFSLGGFPVGNYTYTKYGVHINKFNLPAVLDSVQIAYMTNSDQNFYVWVDILYDVIERNNIGTREKLLY